MNQDAVESPSERSFSPDYQLEIRDKHSLGMARDINVLSGSDVDSLQLNEAAESAKCRRQVSANTVDPSPIHAIVTPSHSHKRLRLKNDWLSKLNALKNRISAPTFSSLDVFSLSKKYAGDVDLVQSKEKQAEIQEDGVDPNPCFTEISVFSEQEGNKAISRTQTENRDVDGCEDDGVPVPSRKRNTGSDFGLGVDSVFYDYEGSHCVDSDIYKINVDESRSADAFERCECEDFPSEGQSGCVDPLSEFPRFDSIEHFKKADRVDAQNYINEVFSDSVDFLSSSIDAQGETQRDWEPHEAETILSDIYQDLGEACICVVEDGCICSLEECQCPDKDFPRTTAQGMEESLEVDEDFLDRENTSSGQPDLYAYSSPKSRTSQLDGTSIDQFHHSTFHPELDQVFNKKFKRRKNNKLSERVICKRRLSPMHFETEVDPKQCEVEETTGISYSDETESVDPFPVRASNNTTSSGSACHKSSGVNESFHQTEVSPDIFYSEDYNIGKDIPQTETPIGDTQLLLDCIAAADDNILKNQTAAVDTFEKSHGAEAEILIKSQTEVSEDGFSCLTEMKSKSSQGALHKTDFMDFKTNIYETKNENANKQTSDISQISDNLHITTDNITPEIYHLPAQNLTKSQFKKIGHEQGNNATCDLETHPLNSISSAEMGTFPVSTLAADSKHGAAESAPQSTTEDTPKCKKQLASDASVNLPVNRVHVSRIPRPTKSGGKSVNAGNTESRSSSVPCMTTQSKESQGELSRRSYTKLPNTSESECKPTDEEAGDDHPIKPYVPQVITIFKHKDLKTATTIPKASSKSPKTATVSTPKKTADWNYSTAVEKPKKGVTRPKPLVSRRKSSQSDDCATADSSKHSLSSAITEESTERIPSSLSGNMSECSTKPSRVQKTDKHSSSVPKQPFRPAGTTSSCMQHDRRFPPSNSARCHPYLRIPGRQVQVPVIYPSSVPQKTTSNEVNQTNTEGDPKLDFIEDFCKACIMPDIFPETGENANNSNFSAWAAQGYFASQFYPWPARKTPLVTKTRLDPMKNNTERKPVNSANLPKRTHLGNVSTFGQQRQLLGCASQHPVMCWKHSKTRKLGSIRSANCLNKKPFSAQINKPSVFLSSATLKPTNHSQPEHVKLTDHIPVIDFHVALKELESCHNANKPAHFLFLIRGSSQKELH